MEKSRRRRRRQQHSTMYDIIAANEKAKLLTPCNQPTTKRKKQNKISKSPSSSFGVAGAGHFGAGLTCPTDRPMRELLAWLSQHDWRSLAGWRFLRKEKKFQVETKTKKKTNEKFLRKSKWISFYDKNNDTERKQIFHIQLADKIRSNDRFVQTIGDNLFILLFRCCCIIERRLIDGFALHIKQVLLLLVILRTTLSVITSSCHPIPTMMKVTNKRIELSPAFDTLSFCAVHITTH